MTTTQHRFEGSRVSPNYCIHCSNVAAAKCHIIIDEPGDRVWVVAFDPGQTTGWCAMGTHKDVLLGARHVNDKLHDQLKVLKGEISCLGPANGWDSIGAAMENDGVAEMIDIANSFETAVIVFEDFIIDFNQVTKVRSALSPVTIMAKFEYGFGKWSHGNSDHGRIQEEANLGRVFRQNRSPVKTTCTDDRLKTWKLYDRNSGLHARDATRHAYYFLRNCRGNSVKARELRWRAWPHIFKDPFTEDLKNDWYENQQRRKGTRIERLG